MIARISGTPRQIAALSLALGLAFGFAGEVRAQGHTPDPYNIVGEYNRQYEPYMYASEPNSLGAFPNQDRLYERAGNRNANRFQSYIDSEDGESDLGGRSVSPRQSGPGVPYYRANRRYDEQFQRTYRPNEAADKSYYSNQDQRNVKYFEALREKDPRKRAQLLRDYNLENLRSARALSSGRGMTDRERDKELDRDAPLNDGPASTRRSTTGSGVRPGVSASPSLSPSPRVSGSAPNGLLRAPAPRTSRPVPSNSEILRRAEAIERENRSPAPAIPRSGAPVPRSSSTPAPSSEAPSPR